MRILLKTWDWLTAPSAALTRPAERRQARLLATLLAFLVLLSIIVEIIAIAATGPLDHHSGFYITGSSIVILAAIYGLSRTRHYQIATWLTIIFSSASVFAATIYGSAPGDTDVGLLFFLILPVLFASMFSSLRATFIVLLVNAAGTLGVLFLFPEVHLIDLPLGYLLIVSGLVMLATHHQKRLEHDRQAELAVSEKRYRNVVDHQTELICRFRPGGTLTFVNATYCRYFDRPREALLGHSFLPLVLEADRAKVTQHLASFSQKKRVATIAYRVVAAGGHVRWQQWIDRPIFDQQGKVTEFQSVGRDVTEQIQAEQALQKAHDALEGRVQERTAALRATNTSLRHEIKARQHAEKLLQIQRDLAVAQSSTNDLTEAMQRLLTAALRIEGIDCGGVYLVDQHSGALDLLAHQGLPPEFVASTRHHKAGSPQARLVMTGQPTFQRYAETLRETQNAVRQREGLRALAVIPVQYEGQVIAALNLASHTYDEIPERARHALEATAAQVGSVIARVKTAAALLESQRNLQALFDTLDDFLFILDVEGHILHFNPAVEKRLGYTAQELDDMNVLHIHPPQRREEADNLITAMIKDQARLCTIPLVTKDGTQIAVETRVVRGRWDDQPVLFGISRDITPRVKAQEKLQRLNEELEQRVIQRTRALRNEVAERTRAENETHRRNRELELLNRVISAATSTLDVASVLQVTCRELARTLDLPMAAAGLLSEDGATIVPVAEHWPAGVPSVMDQVFTVANSAAIERLLTTRAPLAIADTQADAQLGAFQTDKHRYQAGALLLLPVTVRDRVAGILGLAAAAPRLFSAEEIALAQNVVASASQALETAQLYQKLAAHARRLEILRKIDQAILEAQSPETIAQSALRHIRELVPCQRASIVVFDFETDQGTVLATHTDGATRVGPGTQIPLAAFDIHDTLRDGQRHTVEDIQSQGELPLIVQTLRDEGMRAYLSAPFIVQNELIGALYIGANAVDAFTHQHEEIAQELAGPLALAIWHAHLYKQVQRHSSELEQRVAERTAELRVVNAELARAARAKDEFLANMSHELRTPLHALLGKAETLQEGTFGPLNEKQIDALHTVQSSGRHLLALVNDILDVAKIESGKLQLALGPVAVPSLCKSSLRLTRQSAHKKRIAVSFQHDDEVEVIWADGRRLKQILVNLLSNAVKFTPVGGQIGLDVKGDAQEKVVHFIVWDTGIGISPEDLAQLFQPFVQLDSSLARQHTGSGLGLSLVRHLTALHGGSVRAESERGQGSRFTVSLPWKTHDDSIPVTPATLPAAALEEGLPASPHPEAGPPPSAAPSSIPPAQPKATILLAEDNEENIDTISEYLQFKGYQVIVARDGIEALARAQETRPDLILMDVQMPEMDGLETISRIRADAELAAVPIIALTALAMPGDQGRCLDAGANQYLSKPVRLTRLADIIAAQLKQRADDKPQAPTS